MSMVAGEFTECYSNPTDKETFSVVATVFFLDSAAHVLKYIDTIHHVLEPGNHLTVLAHVVTDRGPGLHHRGSSGALPLSKGCRVPGRDGRGGLFGDLRDHPSLSALILLTGSPANPVPPLCLVGHGLLEPRVNAAGSG